MEENMNHQHTSLYQITIQGNLGSNWSQCFDGMSVIPQDGSDLTILTGEIADQPKLRGILNRLWDLNLNVISVIKIHD